MNPGVVSLQDGCFQRSGERFVPFGVNYWPGSCGPAMWSKWPEQEIARDLELTAALGMNAIRFFLLWEDFQPEEGRIDHSALDKLDRFLELCRQFGIMANPSLFVGWMSGKAYLPAWRNGRNMFTDPAMRQACLLLARKAGEVIAAHAETVFAVDMGNELDVLDDSTASLPSQVSDWIGAVCAELRAAGVKAPLLSGADHQQAFNECGWRFDNQTGCDLHSIHAYPVPQWVPVKFGGRLDPLGQAIYPYAISHARAYAPVILQEFGVLGAKSPAEQSAYLEALLPACWEAGANGFLWWCLRDFDESIPPYTTFGFEAQLGLVDSSGAVKAGHEPFMEFGRTLADRQGPKQPDALIYIPEVPYQAEVPDRGGNDPNVLYPRMAAAFHALCQCGVRPALSRHPVDGLPLFIIGAKLTLDELARLRAWVEAGGRLVYHGVPQQMWGPAQAELLGGEIADLRSPCPVSTTYGGSLVLSHWPGGMIIQAWGNGAEVLSADSEGRPVVFRRQLALGEVVWTTALPEDEILALGPIPAKRDRWVKWFVQDLLNIDCPAVPRSV